MNDLLNLQEKLINSKATWEDFSCILKMQKKDFIMLLPLAHEIKLKNFGNILKIFIPGKKFPAISITGSECKLQCEHCNGKYLNGMKGITNPEELRQYLFSLWKNGGTGALISGGCEEDGSVPLYNFLDAIQDIKEKTTLVINTHTGLLNELTAKKLAEAKIDIVSFDINTDERVIKGIYHLNKDVMDYENAIKLLQKYNLFIVPHICVGLFFGKLHSELDAIKFIKKYLENPSIIVVIVLIPPKSSKTKFSTPDPLDVAKILAILRFVFPSSEIALGCMRPKTKEKERLEKLAIKAGINRIVLPSRKTINWIKNYLSNTHLSYFSACCALPQKYEPLAEPLPEHVK
ncbi:MAG: radical SAM protein [Promethearchaeota archaeon]